MDRQRVCRPRCPSELCCHSLRLQISGVDCASLASPAHTGSGPDAGSLLHSRSSWPCRKGTATSPRVPSRAVGPNSACGTHGRSWGRRRAGSAPDRRSVRRRCRVHLRDRQHPPLHPLSPPRWSPALVALRAPSWRSAHTQRLPRAPSERSQEWRACRDGRCERRSGCRYSSRHPGIQ